MKKRAISKPFFGVNKFLYCLLLTSFGLIGLLWYVYVLRIKEASISMIDGSKENPQDVVEVEAKLPSTIIAERISKRLKELENLFTSNATKHKKASIKLNREESHDSEHDTPQKNTKLRNSLSTSVETVIFNPQQLHFVHIPKCGGTSMTALLRQVACVIDPMKNVDCCTNPGFCDFHAMRRCQMIKGCVSHFPNRKFIFSKMPSITILREPVSRMMSAWFYRGHSPNIDFFQVRPWFKEIQTGKRPKVKFPEYLEMHEYHNIQTRMLGADSFPYRNITVTEEIFDKAVLALRAFFFVGLQEEYELSAELMLRTMNVSVGASVGREREQKSRKLEAEKAAIKGDTALMTRARAVNSFDARLYTVAVDLFCRNLQRFPDLFAKLSTKITCSVSANSR